MLHEEVALHASALSKVIHDSTGRLFPYSIILNISEDRQDAKGINISTIDLQEVVSLAPVWY